MIFTLMDATKLGELHLKMDDTVFSVIDKPLSDNDAKYADFYCVYNNGRIVDKFYDISKIKTNKHRKTSGTCVEFVFSLTYETNHNFDIDISEYLKKDLLEIWKIVEITQDSIVIPSYVGFAETVIRNASKYKLFSLQSRFDYFKKLYVLLFSTDLHDPHNTIYRSFPDEMVSYFYSDEIYPLYIKCLEIYKTVFSKSYNTRPWTKKTNLFYKLLHMFMDNLIINFPEEKEKIVSAKTRSIVEKLTINPQISD